MEIILEMMKGLSIVVIVLGSILLGIGAISALLKGKS